MDKKFDVQLGRLKSVLKIKEDQEVAKLLGMNKAAFSARKRAGSFPEEKLYALALKRPDLGLDVSYVLSGVTEEAASALAAKEARS